MQLTEFTNYRSFLLKWIEKNAHIRACRSILAEAAGCHRTYLSQVFAGKAELTPEQAERLSQFFKFDQDESLYFLDLVLHSRSSTKELSRLLEQRMANLKQRRENLSTRFQDSTSADEEESRFYYSSWLPAAVHLAVALPGMKSAAEIADKFSVSKNKVEEILRKLEAYQFVTREKIGWSVGRKSLHLSQESALYPNFHSQWRLLAAQADAQRRPESLHYSALYTLSKADLKKLRKLLLDCIDRSRTLVQNSPEEEIVMFLCDIFVPGT